MKHPMFYILPVILGLLTWGSMAEIPTKHPIPAVIFSDLATAYTQQYQDLDIPPLSASWSVNLDAERKAAGKYNDQEIFFRDMATQFGTINPKDLNTCQYINYRILSYETDLNLARLPIAKAYAKSPSTVTPNQNIQGLAHVPHGRDWYIWYLQKWLATDITPDDIMAFGEREIADAMADLARLEADITASNTATNLTDFIENKATSYQDNTAIKSAYTQVQSRVEQNLHKLFKPYDIGPINIKANANPQMARAPGYYIPPTFFYGWDGTSYRAQDTDFLFIHEGIPGHHFQIQIADNYNICTFTMPDIFYSAFAEGWAAYVETLGPELGLYANFETRLGAIDWDLIRSTRVYLDVAINYLGWSDTQAQAYWQEKLPPHLHTLAAREIKRMRDWPAQVITYKVGADAILKLRDQEKERLGDNFDIRVFHDKLLRLGPVPLSIMKDVFAHIPAR
jgi:uncharacterized protein (DUF885 family)